MAPTIMSMLRLTMLIMTASVITAACVTGKSAFRIESTVRSPRPGQANTVSVITAPPRS